MLPVTRANLDHICCICLLDIRPTVFDQKVFDIKKSPNTAKMLKLTAHITILKNPINQKYIDDYCRKICETCFIKSEYSYNFREKIIASTTTLKELLENNNLNDKEVERLSFFCRICLNRQKVEDIKCLDMMHLNWLKNCSGIRFTSLDDKEPFRIKEGTNINEIAVINDTKFPQQLCLHCLKKLKNVEEFRISSTQSFEYMISVMGDTITSPDHIAPQEFKQSKKNIIWKKIPQLLNCRKQVDSVFELNIIKAEHDQNQNTAVIQNPIEFTCDMEPMIDAERYSNMTTFENNIFQNVKDFNDDLANYSDNSDEGINLNFNTQEVADCSDNDNQNDHLKKARVKKSKQNKIIKRHLKSEENIKNDNAMKTENKNEMLSIYPQNPRIISEQLKENNETTQSNFPKNNHADDVKETYVCENCSKEFSSKATFKRHQRTVHKFDLPNMYECIICSKIFKRKSHFTDHIQAVHEKLRPFKCSYCEKTFSAKSSKRVHELSHTGDFPFICNMCGKGFRRSNQLKIHLDIHTENPELLCPICKRSQKSKEELENHLKVHNDKRLQCPLCGKFFTRNFHLKDHHNAVHLKLRPFKCQFCDSAFGDRKTRRIHEKTHTEDRPFKCSVCKMGFNAQYGLTRHIKEFCNKLENNNSTNQIKKNM